MNNKKTKKFFSTRIKSLRKEKGLTQKELADMTGLTAPAIGSYERGIRLPRTNKLKELATFFNVSSDYLLGKTDNKDNINEIISTITENVELYNLWTDIIKNPTYIDIIKLINKLDKDVLIKLKKILEIINKDKLN
ncbi:MAG: helix-turn-helix domain-containing protein [archaeon]